MLFEKMVASKTCKHKSDVVSVVEGHVCCDEIYQNYRFGYWTFDTCSPERLRFASPGVQRYTVNEHGSRVYERCDEDEYFQGEGEEDHVDIYKLIYVDLLANHNLVIDEEPESCTVRLKLLRPNYQLFALRACMMLEVRPIIIRLSSVFQYSEVRKVIVTESTKMLPALVSACESFLFCSGCWKNQSTMSDVPNPHPQAENVRTACKNNNIYCLQYSWDRWDATDWKDLQPDLAR